MVAHLGDQEACVCRPLVAASEGFAYQPHTAAAQATSARGQVWRSAAVAVMGVLMAGSVMAAGAAAEEPLKADPKAGAETFDELCVACHGENGNSTQAANPKLAGQHMEYLIKQLTEFKPGEDGAPAVRNNAIMMGFASQLSPQDMLNVASFLATQKLTEPAASKDPELVELGRQIYRGGIAAKGVPACAACHGPAGDGIPSQYPSLHGQFAEYTEAQLVAFRDGTRGNNAPMKAIALKMTDPEIKAVSDYIAGLRNQQ